MPDSFNIKRIKAFTRQFKIYTNSPLAIETFQRKNNHVGPLFKPLTYITHLGGTRMKMKFKEYNKISVGSGSKKYPMIEFKGTQIGGQGDGEDRNLRFFPSEKDMYAEIKNATSGDILNVKMTQNGKYWNPTAITNETKDGGDDIFKPDPERTKQMQAIQKKWDDHSIRRDAMEMSVAARKDTDKFHDIINRAAAFEEYLKNGAPNDEDMDIPEPDMDDDDD